MRDYDVNCCRVITEEEIDEALTEIYLRQGRYNVINHEIYDCLTGKFIGHYDKKIIKEEYRK